MIFLVTVTCLTYVPIVLCMEANVRDIQDNYIQLRDYDFVGEDKRLSGILAQRLAVLRKPVNLSDLGGVYPDERDEEDEINETLSRFEPKMIQPKPDQLELNLKRFPKANVSLDYGEMFDVNGDVSMEMNTTWLLSGSEDFNMTGLMIGNITASDVNGNLTVVPLPEYINNNQSGNLTAGRRAPIYWDPSYWEYNMKVLQIMKQNIYSVQNKLMDIEPTIQKYQTDERFRIAYIFNRLDEWKRNIRTVYHAMIRYRYYPMRFKLQLWYYEHVLRVNIDITYSVEFLIHLHGSFMKKLEEVLPRADREEIREMQRKREQMKQMQMRPTLNPFAG